MERGSNSRHQILGTESAEARPSCTLRPHAHLTKQQALLHDWSRWIEASCAQDAFAQPTTLRKYLFGLCFLHAVLCERRKFGALGWNIPYAFSDADLQASARTLQNMAASNELRMDGVKYLVSTILYGGRVTDDKDRRFLLAQVDEVISEELNGDGFALDSGGGKYGLPSDSSGVLHSLEGTLKFVRQSWPQEDDAAVFGLHVRADSVAQHRAATELLAPFASQLARSTSALQLTPQTGASADASSKEDPLQALVNDICGRLPADFDVERVAREYPPLYAAPMNIVLGQETDRFNKLLGAVRSSMKNLALALKGFVVMSDDLDEAYNALTSGRLPKLWTRVSYPSLKPPAAYIDDLLQRLAFFRGWIERGQPDALWMPAFFFPQGFLKSALTAFVRRRGNVAIDDVIFAFHVLNERPSQPPQDGVIIHGLFLEGARFDGAVGLLAEPLPNQSLAPLPELWLQPMHKDEKPHRPSDYNCPLYKTAERRGELSTTGQSTNFVMFLELRTDKPAKHWIRRAVAAQMYVDDPP